jgi:hypothetical protein
MRLAGAGAAAPCLLAVLVAAGPQPPRLTAGAFPSLEVPPNVGGGEVLQEVSVEPSGDVSDMHTLVFGFRPPAAASPPDRR